MFELSSKIQINMVLHVTMYGIDILIIAQHFNIAEISFVMFEQCKIQQ